VKVVVQHGVGDPNWTPGILRPDAVAEFARRAERSGYAGLAFTDHPAPTVRWTEAGGEGSADAMTSLAFCAAHTSVIRLLTFVLVLPYRNPFLTAHQVTTLDALSAGRLSLGLGTGYLKGEQRALGVDPDNRRARFDENLRILLDAWRQQSVTAQGDGWSAREVHVQPRVTQTPHPPLFFHGNSAFGRERAARHGAGWIGVVAGEELARTMRTPVIADLDAVGAAIRDLRERAERHGRDPAEIDVGVGGLAPMLDVRRPWDTAAVLASAERAEALGVDTMYVTTCGDDPEAAADSVAEFGAQVVAAVSRE